MYNFYFIDLFYKFDKMLYLRIEEHFFFANKKVYFNPYIYAKVTNNKVTVFFHWKIFAAVFLCFIAGE